MIRNGTKWVGPHPKQISFPLTFGTIGATQLPASFSADAELAQPDQNADGYPFGCTDYMVRECATSEDLFLYKAGFNYDHSREYEGVSGQHVGVEVKDALKMATVYGLIKEDDPNGNPLDHRRAPYSEVHPANGLDYFDSIRSAMVVAYLKDKKKHSCGVATFWLPVWAQINPDGTVPDIYNYDGKPEHYSWHAWALVGWEMINGEVQLKAKTWQGRQYGKGGYSYYTRDKINKIFDEWGTGVYMQLRATTEDYKQVRLTLIETTFYYIRKMIAMGRLGDAFTNLVALLKLIKQ